MFTIILQSQFGSVKNIVTKNKKLTRVKAAIEFSILHFAKTFNSLAVDLLFHFRGLFPFNHIFSSIGLRYQSIT